MKYRVFLPILAGVVGLAVGVMTAPNARAGRCHDVCDQQCAPCRSVCDHYCKDSRTGQEFCCASHCAPGTGSGCCSSHQECEPVDHGR